MELHANTKNMHCTCCVTSYKPLLMLLSVHVTSVLFLAIILARLRASIGVARSYSSRPFVCALAETSGSHSEGTTKGKTLKELIQQDILAPVTQPTRMDQLNDNSAQEEWEIMNMPWSKGSKSSNPLWALPAAHHWWDRDTSPRISGVHCPGCPPRILDEVSLLLTTFNDDLLEAFLQQCDES